MTRFTFVLSTLGLTLGGVTFAAGQGAVELEPLTFGFLLTFLVFLSGLCVYVLQRERLADAAPLLASGPRRAARQPDLTDRLLALYEQGKRLKSEEGEPFEAYIVSACSALERDERETAEQDLDKAETYLRVHDDHEQTG